MASTSQIVTDSDGSGFPERLKKIIGTQSVRSFAHACGLSDTVVRQYLSARSEPTRPSLLALARGGQVCIELACRWGD